MASSPLLETLVSRRLVCDGAMGTQLMQAGLEQGASGEVWNLTHPERVRDIQRRYVAAGADCIISNTFGGSRLMLERHGVAADVVAINQAAARIAREALDDQPGFVLGDLGPLGIILEPYGDLPYDDAVTVFTEQAQALVEGGVDAIIIETQTGLEEMGAAIEAAQAAEAPCIITSFAYDLSMDQTFFKTMMGVAPETAAEFVQEKGADIVALNCGTGMDMAGAVEVTEIYREVCNLPVMIQPNAGLPMLENMQAVYKQLPEETAARATDALAAGANIIGSCCGSTPDHTRAIRAKVDAFNAEQART